MQTTFETIDEASPGSLWQARFNHSWPAYKKWYTAGGIRKRPTYRTCYNQLKAHMPELLPTYESLCELAGGSDVAARFLSLYNPPAYIAGCSQIIWPTPTERLIRNYDYSPRLLDGMILKSAWTETEVIAISDCLIGVLDGMNQHGLCVSLTFGGSKQIGEGFGIPIILRYILETCTTTTEAKSTLKRLATHMAYNVSVIDAQNRFFTAHLFPGKSTEFSDHKRTATNHQPFDNGWTSYAQETATLERELLLEKLLAEPELGYQQILYAFSQPPLFSTNYKRGIGTLYTAIYQPDNTSLEVRWPQHQINLSFEHFIPGRHTIQYPNVQFPPL